MLHCQHRCRHQQRALLALGYALKRGAKRNLRFSEADIAAQKALHGHGALHITLDFLRATKLIIRFVICKSKLEIALKIRILRKGIALCAHSLCIERDKLLCHILNGRTHLCLCLFPFVAAEAIYFNIVAFAGADIF